MRSPRDPGWWHRVVDGPLLLLGEGRARSAASLSPQHCPHKGPSAPAARPPRPSAPRQPKGACCGCFFTKTPCKMDVRKHPHPHIPPSLHAAPRRIWVYLRPSQNRTPDGDGGTTLITEARGPRWSEPGTSTPAVPPRLRHDAVVNADTGPGRAAARRAGARHKEAGAGRGRQPRGPLACSNAG